MDFNYLNTKQKLVFSYFMGTGSWGSQIWSPPNFLSCGYQDLFPGGEVEGCETDKSPPSSAEVKNVGSYTSTPSYVFMALCLIKYRIHFHGILLS